MSRAQIHLLQQPNKAREAAAFTAGLEACGYTVHERIADPGRDDVFLCWNRMGPANNEAKRFEAAGTASGLVPLGQVTQLEIRPQSESIEERDMTAAQAGILAQVNVSTDHQVVLTLKQMNAPRSNLRIPSRLQHGCAGALACDRPGHGRCRP